MPFKWALHHNMPIVNNIGSELHEICKYLQPIIANLNKDNRYSIKSTDKLIHEIQNLNKHTKIENNDRFFTADIKSLYTNINLHKCMSALSNSL